MKTNHWLPISGATQEYIFAYPGELKVEEVFDLFEKKVVLTY